MIPVIPAARMRIGTGERLDTEMSTGGTVQWPQVETGQWVSGFMG